MGGDASRALGASRFRPAHSELQLGLVGWTRVYHYLSRQPDEMYFGLGERAGETDRTGQRYRMTNIDAMGYNARTSDPLYKHIPFYITWKRQAKLAFGIFYDTVADCTFDLGRERDAYHGPYRYFVAEHGDLDYYFIAGPELAGVVRRFTWLTGQPAFPPKWSLGYSGSTMTYTESPNAQERMNEFLLRCKEHDILCDSFHLSSGYTSMGGRRYVFNWDRAKFPDPEAFAARVICRRWCQAVRKREALSAASITRASRRRNTGGTPSCTTRAKASPSLAQFWGESAPTWISPTRKTVAWWKRCVTE